MGTELSPSNFSKEASREGRKNCRWDACLVTIFISHEPPSANSQSIKDVDAEMEAVQSKSRNERLCRPATEL